MLLFYQRQNLVGQHVVVFQHFLDGKLIGTNTQDCLPFFQKRRNQCPQMPAIPSLQYPLTLFNRGFRTHMKFKGGIIPANNFGRAGVFDNAQAIAPTFKIMTLTADHFAAGLPGLGNEPCPLPFYPAEFADHRQPHRLGGTTEPKPRRAILPRWLTSAVRTARAARSLARAARTSK